MLAGILIPCDKRDGGYIIRQSMKSGWKLSLLGAFSLVLYSRRGLPRRKPHFYYSKSGEIATSWDRSQVPLLLSRIETFRKQEVGVIIDIKWG